jgi:hypothetical protein
MYMRHRRPSSWALSKLTFAFLFLFFLFLQSIPRIFIATYIQTEPFYPSSRCGGEAVAGTAGLPSLASSPALSPRQEVSSVTPLHISAIPSPSWELGEQSVVLASPNNKPGGRPAVVSYSSMGPGGPSAATSPFKGSGEPLSSLLHGGPPLSSSTAIATPGGCSPASRASSPSMHAHVSGGVGLHGVVQAPGEGAPSPSLHTHVSRGDGLHGGAVPASLEDIVAYGGIPDPAGSGLRSSLRIKAQPNADMPQLERAMHLTERRQSSATPGISCVKKLSFADLPDDDVASRADRLGICLGDSSVTIKKSIHCIKELEKSRNLVFLNKSIHADEYDSSSLFLSRASNLSEDLIDDVDKEMPDHEGPSNLFKQINQKKISRPINKLTVRRSARINKLNIRKQ